jgi:hypothetical protein
MIHFVPEDLRFAVFGTDMSQYGIVFVFRERSAAVVGIGDALGERPAGRRVDADQGLFRSGLKPGRVAFIDHGRAGKDRAQLVGMDGMIQLLPVKEIRTEGVSPGHVPPVDTLRIVLEEKVIFPGIINQAIGVVGPVLHGCEMELWTIGFLIEFVHHDECSARLGAQGNALGKGTCPVVGRHLGHSKLDTLTFQTGHVPTQERGSGAILADRLAERLALDQ